VWFVGVLLCVGVFRRLLMYAGICWNGLNALVFAGVRWYLVGISWYVVEYVSTCLFAMECAKTCWSVLVCVGMCWCKLEFGVCGCVLALICVGVC